LGNGSHRISLHHDGQKLELELRPTDGREAEEKS